MIISSIFLTFSLNSVSTSLFSFFAASNYDFFFKIICLEKLFFWETHNALLLFLAVVVLVPPKSRPCLHQRLPSVQTFRAQIFFFFQFLSFRSAQYLLQQDTPNLTCIMQEEYKQHALHKLSVN